MNNKTLPNLNMEFTSDRYGNLMLRVTMGYEEDAINGPRSSVALLDPTVFERAITRAVEKHKLNPWGDPDERVQALEKKVQELTEQIELLASVREAAPAEEVGAW